MRRQIKINRQTNLLFAAAILAFLFVMHAPIAAQQTTQTNNQYFVEGVKLAKEARYQEAIAAFRKSNTLVGETAKAYANIGICYMSLKQTEESIRNFQKAIALDPKLFAAYWNLGVVFYGNGQYEEALVAYGEALSLSPNEASEKRVKEDIALAESALAKNKANQQGNNQSDTAQNNNQTANRTDEYYEQGLALFRSKDYKKAIKAFEQSLKVNPNNPATFYNLGSAYYNTNQFTKSAQAYQETLRLNPNFQNAKEYLADAQMMMKEEKAAREAAWANLANSMKNNRSTQRTTPTRTNKNDEEGEIAAPRRGNAENRDAAAVTGECSFERFVARQSGRA